METSSNAKALTLIYEDEDRFIINKPSGIASVSKSHTELGQVSVIALLRSHLNAALPDSGLVHRLDTGTSGCLIIAKTEAEWKRLRELFRQRKIMKIYRARVRIPKATLPTHIRTPIVRSPKHRGKMIALKTPAGLKFRGRPQSAHTEILDQRGSEITLRLHTGVMHQLRVHLSHLDAPIDGDSLYGGQAHPRLCLHAWKLEIPLPSGTLLDVQAQLLDWNYLQRV